MGLEPQFTRADVKRMLQSRVRIIERRIMLRLHQMGEKCVVEMRTNHGYKIWTSNLINSTGYVITRNGVIVTMSGFEGGGEGEANAQSIAARLSERSQNGYSLIVIAGMNYAHYVEALGYNVISSAESLVERQLPAMLKKLRDNINSL